MTFLSWLKYRQAGQDRRHKLHGDKIEKETAEFDDYITTLYRGWIESEKVRDFLKEHYNIKKYSKIHSADFNS